MHGIYRNQTMLPFMIKVNPSNLDPQNKAYENSDKLCRLSQDLVYTVYSRNVLSILNLYNYVAPRPHTCMGTRLLQPELC